MALDPYGHNTVNVTPSQHESFQHNNTYIFRNCSFLRNEAVWMNASKPHDFVDTPELPFSRGGGLAIYFRSNATGCAIKIESCLFNGNRANWGGGLQVGMTEKTQDNHVTVDDTKCEHNKGFLAGGGARMGNFIKGVERLLNTFTANNCLFVNNTALWGGGTSVYGSSIPGKCAKHTDNDISQFVFNHCQWTDNTGTVGAASGFFLLNQNEDQIGPEPCVDRGRCALQRSSASCFSRKCELHQQHKVCLSLRRGYNGSSRSRILRQQQRTQRRCHGHVRTFKNYF